MLRARFTAWLIAGVLLVGAAGPGPALAIVGSSTDDGGRLAPYVVMVLSRQGATAGFCSGIVVGREAVLTAAHCVPPGADLRVHFRDDTGKPVLLAVAQALRNPGYVPDAVTSRRKSIDLALVRLSAPLPDRFQPAALAEGSPGAPVGTTFRLAGFGVTRENDGGSSGHLRTGMLAAREPLSAVLLWARDPRGQGTGACTGDSGGPIFTDSGDTVVAITLWSAGNGAARCGALTQALWIAPHRQWIADTLRGWGLAP